MNPSAKEFIIIGKSLSDHSHPPSLASSIIPNGGFTAAAGVESSVLFKLCDE
jgi:hypothetical protein